MSASQNDDFSREPVVGDNLRPWWNLLMIELGVLISIPMFVIGGQLGMSLTLTDLLLSALIGGIILGLVGGLTSHLGARTRCSTALIARSTFGSQGAILIGLVMAVGMTGWWGVQTELFADAFCNLVQKLFHFHIQREITIAVGGIAMITTAALGIKAIGKLAYIAVPLLVAGVCYAFSTLMTQHGLEPILAYHPAEKNNLGLGGGVATVVGGWIVGASMVPDFSRFARDTRHAVVYALGHYSVNYPIFLVICGIMAIGFRSTDLMSHLVPANLTWLLLILIMLATWAANDCNLYSSSLGLTVVLPRLKRSHLAIFGGTIGILMAELHVAEHVISLLVLLGVFIAPISGVIITAGIDPRDAVLPEKLRDVPKLRIAPFVAWIIGAGIGFLATPREALGLGVIKLSTIPTVDAILVSMLVMSVLKSRFVISCLTSARHLAFKSNHGIIETES
jgi:cytosine permease